MTSQPPREKRMDELKSKMSDLAYKFSNLDWAATTDADGRYWQIFHAAKEIAEEAMAEGYEKGYADCREEAAKEIKKLENRTVGLADSVQQGYAAIVRALRSEAWLKDEKLCTSCSTGSMQPCTCKEA